MSEIKPIPLPSGIASPKGSVGFFEGQQGLLECIDLDSGTVLARSNEPLRPLLGDLLGAGEKLLAWSTSNSSSNSAIVRLAELRDGVLETVWQTAVELPDWVETAEAEGYEFSLEAVREGNEFVLLWEAHRYYVGGMRPIDELLEQLTNDAAGRIAIGASNGQPMEMQPREIPEEDLDAAELACRLPMVPYLLGGEWRNKPWRSGKIDALLLDRDTEGRGGLYLRHADPSDRNRQAIAEYLLVSETDSEPLVSLDGEHLFVRQPGTDSWTVFSTQNANRIANLRLESGIEEIAVLDSPDGKRAIYALDDKQFGPGRIVTAVRRTLKACSLETGELMWSHFLFDKELPPSPLLYP